MLRRIQKGYWIKRSIIPIGYSLRFDLRDRLTVRSLPLHTNPWAYGDNVYIYIIYRYLCQHSHFWYLQLI